MGGALEIGVGIQEGGHGPLSPLPSLPSSPLSSLLFFVGGGYPHWVSGSLHPGLSNPARGGAEEPAPHQPLKGALPLYTPLPPPFVCATQNLFFVFYCFYIFL